MDIYAYIHIHTQLGDGISEPLSRGDADAQFLLGTLFFEKNEIEVDDKDDEVALDWILQVLCMYVCMYVLTWDTFV